MQLLPVTLLLIATLCAPMNLAKLAYERGSCEEFKLNTLPELFEGEIRSLVNPAIRYSQNKIIQFDLYTRRNPNRRQILETNNVKGLRNSNFNAKWPVRFLIHGWAGKGTTCSNAAIKDAYLARGNFNVILVDWSVNSYDLSYIRITKQLPALAATLLKFIRFLHRETGAPYELMYLIGHSAGAHLAGITGKLLRPERFGAIFGLDPAGLTQRFVTKPYRLGPGDATYVETIHTDTTLLGNPSTELSQAAFFVNWGQGQSHCPNATAAEFDFVCDHFAALYYFAESLLEPKSFGALRCRGNEAAAHAHNFKFYTCGCGNSVASANAAIESCDSEVHMGGEPAVPKIGVFYLSTRHRPPYGLGNVTLVRPSLPPSFLRCRDLVLAPIIKLNRQ